MSKLNDLIVFKGGTALKKCYYSDYRFSEDLDFTLLKAVDIVTLEKMLNNVYSTILDMANIRLALKKKEATKNSYTFYVNFSGPLGADIGRKEIKLDFTIKEKIIYSVASKTLLRGYEEYTDLPSDIMINVYTLEEIFIEKCLSIIDRSRNEPRDIYDLWYLASNECSDCVSMAEGIKLKGSYKGITSFNILDALNRKERNYESLWKAKLEQHMLNLPHFNKVYRELKRHLRPLNQELT